MKPKRVTYLAMVCEPGEGKQPSYLRYLSGKRKGELKVFTYREAAAIEAGRSYNNLSPLACVVILPTPEHLPHAD